MTVTPEMSVTNNSLSRDCPHPDNHAKQIFVYQYVTEFVKVDNTGKYLSKQLFSIQTLLS